MELKDFVWTREPEEYVIDEYETDEKYLRK